MNIELNDDAVMLICTNTLEEDYGFCLESIRELDKVAEENGGLEQYQQEDYRTYMHRALAFLTVLAYYLPKEEFLTLDNLDNTLTTGTYEEEHDRIQLAHFIL